MRNAFAGAPVTSTAGPNGFPSASNARASPWRIACDPNSFHPTYAFPSGSTSTTGRTSSPGWPAATSTGAPSGVPSGAKRRSHTSRTAGSVPTWTPTTAMRPRASAATRVAANPSPTGKASVRGSPFAPNTRPMVVASPAPPLQTATKPPSGVAAASFKYPPSPARIAPPIRSLSRSKPRIQKPLSFQTYATRDGVPTTEPETTMPMPSGTSKSSPTGAPLASAYCPTSLYCPCFAHVQIDA